MKKLITSPAYTFSSLANFSDIILPLIHNNTFSLSSLQENTFKNDV